MTSLYIISIVVIQLKKCSPHPELGLEVGELGCMVDRPLCTHGWMDVETQIWGPGGNGNCNSSKNIQKNGYIMDYPLVMTNIAIEAMAKSK